MTLTRIPHGLRRAALAAVALPLAGCAGGLMSAVLPGQEIIVGQDVFSVTVDGDRAVAMNFATGRNNQPRLYAAAQTAVVQASGCVIVQFEQEPGVNTYRAQLDCAAGPKPGPKPRVETESVETEMETGS